MRNAWVRLGIAVVLAVVADFLLWGYQPGCNVTIFALLVGVVLCARYRHDWRKVGAWVLLWFLLAAGAAIQSSAIGYVLLIGLGWGLLAFAVLPAETTLVGGLLRGAAGGARAFLGPLSESLRRSALGARFPEHKGIPFWVVLLPAGIILLFALLIIPANLVLATWVEDAVESLERLLEELTIERVAFWVVVAFQVFGLLLFSPPQAKAKSGTVLPPAPVVETLRRRNELRAAVATFLGLNILYAAANLVDVAYLWSGFALPHGMTYAEFAHEGAYKLMVAAVFAGITIASFFRVRSAAAMNPTARALAYLFSAQNIVVLLGSARRLQEYMEAYGLTRMRVAAFVWMLVVLIGFVLLAVKLWKHLPFQFLVQANAASVLFVLAAVSLSNIDGFIAEWNVARHEQGQHRQIDVAYLQHLGTPALPALARLSQSEDREVATRARRALRPLAERAGEAEEQWRAWTLRNHLDVMQAREKWDIQVPPVRGSEVVL